MNCANHPEITASAFCRDCGKPMCQECQRPALGSIYCAEHLPAYLESSNPKNLERYGRLGFEPRDEFSMPDDGPPVTTMWRPAR